MLHTPLQDEDLHMGRQISKCLLRTQKVPPGATCPHSSRPRYTILPIYGYFKYCWSTALCQYTCEQDFLGYCKPITFISGNFLTDSVIIHQLSEKLIPFIYLSKDSVFTSMMQNAPSRVITNH